MSEPIADLHVDELERTYVEIGQRAGEAHRAINRLLLSASVVPVVIEEIRRQKLMMGDLVSKIANLEAENRSLNAELDVMTDERRAGGDVR